MSEDGMGMGLAVRKRTSLGGVSPFTPNEFDPIGWWDASDLSTITQVGGKVSQLDDKSGNNNHMTQGTGSLQPTTGTRSQNGQNVLDFVPQNVLVSTILPTKPHTIFAVGKGDVGQGNSYDDGWLAARWRNGIDHHVGLNQRGFGRYQNGQSQILGADATVPRVMSGSEAAGGTPNARAWINGSLIGTNNGATLDWNANLRWALGRSAPLPLNRHALDGWIGEAIVIPTVLSDEDRQTIENYLIAKWGI